MSSAALRDGILAVPVIDITSFRMPCADPAARLEVVRQVDAAARPRACTRPDRARSAGPSSGPQVSAVGWRDSQ